MIRGAKWIAANSRHTKSLVKAWGIADENIMIVLHLACRKKP